VDIWVCGGLDVTTSKQNRVVDRGIDGKVEIVVVVGVVD
jgi:hypothetical protein